MPGPKDPAYRRLVMRRLVALAIVALGVPGSYRMGAATDTIKVDGGQIAGVTLDGVRVFKGIPFAAAPVGDLRWKPPQPVVAWTGVKQADTFGPQCPQTPYSDGSPYAMEPAR
jgi:para-nitrobenzyl esterase